MVEVALQPSRSLGTTVPSKMTSDTFDALNGAAVWSMMINKPASLGAGCYIRILIAVSTFREAPENRLLDSLLSHHLVRRFTCRGLEPNKQVET